MEQENRSTLSERAMFYGTIFGGIMIASNIFYLLGLGSQTFSILFLLLTISSPIIAGKLAINYRRNECDNSMSFIQAWLFLMIMYCCAATLSAIAQFIYFTFMDNGYFMGTILQQMNAVAEIEGIDNLLREEIIKTANLLNSMSHRDVILQIFSTNIIISPIITVFIAIFVFRNGNNKL